MASRANSKSISPISRCGSWPGHNHHRAWHPDGNQNGRQVGDRRLRGLQCGRLLTHLGSRSGLRPVPENIAYYVRGPLPTVDGRARAVHDRLLARARALW